MDCCGFESLLNELEHDLPLAAGARAQALQHAESCASCRARLAAARLLSLELQALARDDETLQAPARVEVSLLSAFRERARHRSRVWRSLSWAGVAAALALGGWMLAAHPWRRSGPAPAAQVQAAPASLPKAASAELSVKPAEKPVAQSAPHKRSRPGGSRAADETAREFIALTGSSYPMEEGMVVQVELPRSAPALVGLPISGGDMSGTVTADVVLGQDGVARAIRFVQPATGKAAKQDLGFTQN